jgi:tetratricopeptide (TPR) repeat protein
MGMPPRLSLAPLLTAGLAALVSLSACGGSLMSSARQSLSEGRYTEAEDYLTQRLEAEPGDGDAHMMLGLIALQRLQTEKAREHLELAKIANPALKTRIEGDYEPILVELEQAVWTPVYTRPSLFAAPIGRFRSPIVVQKVHGRQPGWAFIRVETWVPNDDGFKAAKGEHQIVMLDEQKEFAFVRLDAWVQEQHVFEQPVYAPKKGANLESRYQNRLLTEDDRLLIFGVAVNSGTDTAKACCVKLRGGGISSDLRLILIEESAEMKPKDMPPGSNASYYIYADPKGILLLLYFEVTLEHSGSGKGSRPGPP